MAYPLLAGPVVRCAPPAREISGNRPCSRANLRHLAEAAMAKADRVASPGSERRALHGAVLRFGNEFGEPAFAAEVLWV